MSKVVVLFTFSIFVKIFNVRKFFFVISTSKAFCGTKRYKPSEQIFWSPPGIEPVTFWLRGAIDSDELPGRHCFIYKMLNLYLFNVFFSTYILCLFLESYTKSTVIISWDLSPRQTVQYSSITYHFSNMASPWFSLVPPRAGWPVCQPSLFLVSLFGLHNICFLLIPSQLRPSHPHISLYHVNVHSLWSKVHREFEQFLLEIRRNVKLPP